MSSLTPRIDRLETNYIINGNFDFWQRGISFTGITGNAIYHADRFNLTRGASITALTNSIVQSADVPTVTQSGFKSNFSYLLTTTAVATNLPTSDTVMGPTYHMEGYDFENLIGKTVTLSFWVKSSVVGTYSLLFGRQFTDSYITTYTINLANTWEKKSISVYIDPALNWTAGSGTTNGRGLTIIWTLGAGTGRTVGTLNQWLIGQNVGNANSATNTFCTTLNATFQLSQVMLNESTSNSYFNRAGRALTSELLLCQRYYEKSYLMDVAPGSNSNPGAMYEYQRNGDYMTTQFQFTVNKRAVPTVTLYNTVTGATGQMRGITGGGSYAIALAAISERLVSTSTLVGIIEIYGYHWTADAEL